MAEAGRPPDPPPHPPGGAGGGPGYPPPPPYTPPPGWGAPPPGWAYGGAAWSAPAHGGRVGSGRFHSMGVGELLDAIFSLYRRNFLLIAAISAIVQLPYAVLQFALYEISGVASLSRGPFTSFTAPQANHPLTQQQLQTLQNTVGGVALVGGLLALVSLFVVLPLAEAAVTRAVSDRYLERETSVLTSYGAAIRRLGPLILQSLILLVGTMLATAVTVLLIVALAAAGGRPLTLLGLLLVIPLIGVAIFVYVRTSLAAPAIVLEGLSGWRGLVRSWVLTRGAFWRLFGIRLLVGLIAGIVSGVVTTLLTLVGLSLDAHGQFIVSEIAGAFATVVIGPITYIAVTLLYYDMRIRKEGFDIQMLAQSL